MFDELHGEKDEFVSLARIITRAELKLLNEATAMNLAESWSDIEHHFDYTRSLIAEMILAPEAEADEECLLGRSCLPGADLRREGTTIDCQN